MAYWLSEADNVYEAIYRFYGGRNLPTSEKDVFKGFSGCNRVVLLVTINAMRENWSLGWFTDNKVRRDAAFAEIAADVWLKSDFKADISGIVTFENWVFVAAKSSPNLVGYFSGGTYGDLTNIATAATDLVTDVASGAVDVVKNIITIPADSAGLVAQIAPWIKWGAILWGASKLVKVLKA